MQAILNDDGGAIIPMFASYVFATSKKVGDRRQPLVALGHGRRALDGALVVRVI